MSNFYQSFLVGSPFFNTTSIVSSLDYLEPVTKQRIQAIMAESAANGQPLICFETYRSETRQEALFTQGATQLKEVGVHHWGLAADLVKNVNGEPSWKGSFDFLAVLAQKHGMVSGINWGNPNITHTWIDACHIQRVAVKDQPRLFNGQFYPDDSYDPYL